MSRDAIIIAGTNPPQVLTWIRGDTPADWRPPDGTRRAAESDVPDSWVPFVQSDPVPEFVTRWQMRSWLWRSHGIPPSTVSVLLQQIEDVGARTQALIDWDDAAIVRRDHPMIGTLGAALGMDAAAIDQGFREAAALEQ